MDTEAGLTPTSSKPVPARAVAGTPPYQSEQALRNMALEWQSTFDSVSDAIWLLDTEQRILRSNKAAAALFGKSIEDMLGRHCWEIVHGTSQPIPECPVVRMRRSRKRESMELPVKGRWYQVVADPLINLDGKCRGAIHIVSDITDRKRTEDTLRNMTEFLEQQVEERTATLRETTGRLQRTLTAAHAIAWELDLASGKLLENGPVEEFFGRPKGFRVRNNATFFQNVHPDDRACVRSRMESAIKNANKDLTVEFRLLLPDGNVRWVASSGSVERNAEGRTVRVLGITRDITARKKAEVTLTRTNRALSLLTLCDRALVRATSEQALLDELCRIVVDEGGYRMAWIGYAANDTRKSVNMVAHAGITGRHFPDVHSSWAPNKSRGCPASEAIRTRKPYTCRNISREPLPAACRREALKHGCASALGLPLLTEQGCLGAFVIYATQPEAFDAAEIDLFQQLADDLSFGIKALRGREERKELERRVLDIAEREQRRLGQDLHDGLLQSIVAAGYLIGATQNALARKSAHATPELERARQLIEKSVQQAHELAQGLFPAEMKRGGIGEALEELARHTQDAFGISCRFLGRRGVKLPDISMASHVYRIAQEAVNNAAKHSKAKSINIQLSPRQAGIALIVKDTGVGFPKSTANHTGMGQRIMKYRADILGATLKVESTHGKGTTVTCVLPTGIHREIKP